MCSIKDGGRRREEEEGKRKGGREKYLCAQIAIGAFIGHHMFLFI